MFYCFTVFSKQNTTSLGSWYQQSSLQLINGINNIVAISLISCLCCCQLPDLHALTAETSLRCWPRIRMYLIFAPVLGFEFLSAVINYKPLLPGLPLLFSKQQLLILYIGRLLFLPRCITLHLSILNLISLSSVHLSKVAPNFILQ